MRFWVGITDHEWHRFVAARQFDEVNFWQPSAGRMPVRLEPGAPFLFKLHSSHGSRIVGGGYFAHYSVFPIRIAWDAFEDKNGADTLAEMVTRIERYRRRSVDADTDRIGCFVLMSPFFFSEPEWIGEPGDWAPNIVQGRSFHSDASPGRELWEEVMLRVGRSAPLTPQAEAIIADAPARYGTPVLVRPRLGQGAFRFVVTDAYERRCAVTNERTLPVLEAAHIKPYSQRGPHEIRNGLLLRRDLHTLFDLGYLTIAPDLHVRVSPQIRKEFENGRDYYALDMKTVRLPHRNFPAPDRTYLEWHGDVIFKS